MCRHKRIRRKHGDEIRRIYTPLADVVSASSSRCGRWQPFGRAAFAANPVDDCRFRASGTTPCTAFALPGFVPREDGSKLPGANYRSATARRCR